MSRGLDVDPSKYPKFIKDAITNGVIRDPLRDPEFLQEIRQGRLVVRTDSL